MNALLMDDEVDVTQELFKVYGFMDMGLQKTWVDEKSLIAGTFDANALTFAVGNINLYFDFNPDPDWRGLAEIRFTSAPLGNMENYGGLAGTFQRTNTQAKRSPWFGDQRPHVGRLYSDRACVDRMEEVPTDATACR